MEIRPLALDALEPYLDHILRYDAQSGTEGEPPSGPHGWDERPDRETLAERARRRWVAPIDGLDWRRVWGLYDGARVVGSVQLSGGALLSARHRCDCGIGLERPFRGQGWGRRLMEVAIDWARSQPTLAWIDLGVFEGNDRALALYLSLGFERTGRTPDRFRVDGHSIDDISMSLRVG